MEFWFVRVVPKYFDWSELSKDLLSIFKLLFCPPPPNSLSLSVYHLYTCTWCVRKPAYLRRHISCKRQYTSTRLYDVTFHNSVTFLYPISTSDLYRIATLEVSIILTTDIPVINAVNYIRRRENGNFIHSNPETLRSATAPNRDSMAWRRNGMLQKTSSTIFRSLRRALGLKITPLILLIIQQNITTYQSVNILMT
jgi:hypothetical protein